MQNSINFTSREASIYMFALRYAAARQTGAMMFVADEIVKHWAQFSEREKSQIKKDAEDARAFHAEHAAEILALEGGE